MPYSQNDEEGVILEWFKDRKAPGRFLDIGAYTGKELSNTRALMERGWSGVCVEPNPNSFAALVKNCAVFPSVKPVQVAVAVKSGITPFFASPDAVSTFNKAHRDKWAASGVPFETIPVGCVTMPELLGDHPPPYDFLNLDVEATNWAVFNTVPLSSLGASLLCIEFDDQRKAIEAKCRQHGYVLVHGTSENLIFGKR